MRRGPARVVWTALLTLTLAGGCALRPPAPVSPGAAGGAAGAPPPLAEAHPGVTQQRGDLGRYVAARFADLPGWGDDGADALAGFWDAWLRQCREPQLRTRLAALQDACEAARLLGEQPAAEAVRAYVEQQFQPWEVQAADGRSSGLLTGYYEPILKGARQRVAGQYEVPLWARPADLLAQPSGEVQRSRRLPSGALAPYWSRAELQREARAGLRALAWVADPVEALFLQIQGSGRIDWPDGTQSRLAFADHNGHPYRSIGRWLIERGELRAEQASMQGIKAWAQANPARVDELLAANPRVVFFREEPAEGSGPRGALGVPLSAERSVAVDPRSIDLGSLLWIDSTQPLSQRPLQRLVLAQDVGSAITGAVRADFYWGSGEAAGEAAGRTRQPLRLFVLLPRRP
jgi:membrane-bound lytic murein transglycosylase A